MAWVLAASGCTDPFGFTRFNYPQIDKIDPATGPTKGGTQVTIDGEKFIANTQIFFDDKPCLDINIVSETQIKCVTPIHEAGDAVVTATHVTAGTGDRTATFTYVPPPEYGLKPGDAVEVGVSNISYCTSSTCTGNESTVVWRSNWTILTEAENNNEDPVYISETTGQWEIKTSYLYRVDTVATAMGNPADLFGNTWLAAFGPWNETVGYTDSGIGTFTTAEPPLPTGSPSYPFFDMANWDSANTKFTEYVQAIDPQANIKNQPASRRLEAWYIDSEDNKEHHVWVIFHSVGIVCAFDEEMIDAPANPTRTQADLTAAPYITPKSNISFVYVIRAGGTRQMCNCAADSGCE